MIFPCKDCADRDLGCHDRCPRYLEAKREHDERKAAVKQQHMAYEHVYERYKKYVYKKIKRKKWYK